MPNRAKILVIDDEKKILSLIEDLLGEDFIVLTAINGEDGVELAQSEKPDIVVVDNIMPKMDGMLVAQFLRRCTSTKHIPILMLTALKEPKDRLLAFNAGVDDFISKPFHPDELRARIESKIQRFKSLDKTLRHNELNWHNLRLLPDDGRAYINDANVRLTPIEFAILYDLVSHLGKVRSREKLTAKIWGRTAVDVRLLDSHVASLRRKLKGLAGTITTVYRRGYAIGD